MQSRQSQICNRQTTAVLMEMRDTAQFQNVVSRCLPAFYRRAYRFVRNPHDAEDAVQDALLSAYKHLDQFEGNAKMATWLTSIVTNSALTQLRRKTRRPHISLDEPLNEEQSHYFSDSLADSRPDPENECIWSELHGRIMQSVAELPPSLRKVIQLRHLDGLTTAEAAHVLGVADGTVKAHVSRARTKLKRRMREL